MLYPIGIQDFEKIRKDGYLYVDKTDLIYRIATSGSYFFLSRPRRFGKILLVSTMEAYFKGRKELFEDLAISQLEKDWKEYPVLRLDLSGKAYSDVSVLEKVLAGRLTQWESEYDCTDTSGIPGIRFENIIRAAHEKTGRQVVILVDEYDKPIVDNLTDENLADAFRTQLQGKAELYFQNTMYVMLKFMGQQVQVERHTSNGRIDVLIQTDKYVYILELKRDQDPQDALDQIEQKGYDWPFQADGRKVFKIGATFSTATRRLQQARTRRRLTLKSWI